MDKLQKFEFYQLWISEYLLKAINCEQLFMDNSKDTEPCTEKHAETCTRTDNILKESYSE